MLARMKNISIKIYCKEIMVNLTVTILLTIKRDWNFNSWRKLRRFNRIYKNLLWTYTNMWIFPTKPNSINILINSIIINIHHTKNETETETPYLSNATLLRQINYHETFERNNDFHPQADTSINCSINSKCMQILGKRATPNDPWIAVASCWNMIDGLSADAPTLSSFCGTKLGFCEGWNLPENYCCSIVIFMSISKRFCVYSKSYRILSWSKEVSRWDSPLC